MVSTKEFLAMFEAAAERYPYVEQIRKTTGFERVQALREFYRLANKEILSSPAHVWGIDPYEVDWLSVFTPIERALWHDIRGCGLVVYPQYPIGRFLADFANPKAGFVIECDGAAYHQDIERDRAREAEIRKHGHSVFRISGKDCFTDADRETGAPGVAGRLIREIKEAYF